MLEACRGSSINIAVLTGLNKDGITEASAFDSEYCYASFSSPVWAHPASYPVGTGTHSHGSKGVGCETDHSTPIWC